MGTLFNSYNSFRRQCKGLAYLNGKLYTLIKENRSSGGNVAPQKFDLVEIDTSTGNITKVGSSALLGISAGNVGDLTEFDGKLYATTRNWNFKRLSKCVI